MNAWDRAHAWRSAFMACVVNIVGMALQGLIARNAEPLPALPMVLSGAGGLLLLIFLALRRERLSARACSVVFVLNSAVVATALFVLEQEFTRQRVDWAPFQPLKLGMLLVALLGPRVWAGTLSIALYWGTALLEYALFEPSIRAEIGSEEPMILLVYAILGFLMLVYRRRGLWTERKILQDRLTTEAARRLAQVSLGIRDLANTPVQVIVLVADMLKARHPESTEALLRIRRSTERLTELGRVLSDYDEDFRTEQPASFDAKTLVQREPPRGRDAAHGSRAATGQPPARSDSQVEPGGTGR